MTCEENTHPSFSKSLPEAHSDYKSRVLLTWYCLNRKRYPTLFLEATYKNKLGTLTRLRTKEWSKKHLYKGQFTFSQPADVLTWACLDCK